MYKKLRAFFERQCVFNNGYFFGKETYSQRMKWTFEPYLTVENAFVLNEEEEYAVWYDVLEMMDLYIGEGKEHEN